MIGNDVVDLRLASTQSNPKRNGFLEKAFTASEQEQIQEAKDQAVMVWLLWSMKEAAYKAHQRYYSLPRKLNWHRQECEVTKFDDSKASGVIHIGSDFYFSESCISSVAVFTSAVKDNKTIFRNGFFESSSEAMKKSFFKEISSFYKLPQKELRLRKNTSGIPFLIHHEQEIPVAFSFTSHGKFSAFSISLMNC